MAYKIDSKGVFKKKPKKIVGDIEKEAMVEMAEVSAFSKKAAQETNLFKENTDANYFTVITFNNSGQLAEFLKKIGISQTDNQYIDGAILAKKLGIEIKTPDRKAPGSFRISQQLKDLV